MKPASCSWLTIWGLTWDKRQSKSSASWMMNELKKKNVRHDGRHAHDHDYITRVRDIDADTPARYNADPDRLFESSGCAGKLAVFAVRLDTFEAEKNQQVFTLVPTNPRC